VDLEEIVQAATVARAVLEDMAEMAVAMGQPQPDSN